MPNFIMGAVLKDELAYSKVYAQRISEAETRIQAVVEEEQRVSREVSGEMTALKEQVNEQLREFGAMLEVDSYRRLAGELHRVERRMEKQFEALWERHAAD